MTQIVDAPSNADPLTLSGRAVLRASSRLVAVCLIMSLVYAAFASGSRSGSLSERDPGSYVQLELHPSPLVFAAIAAVYFFAVRRVVTRGLNETRAIQIMKRAAIIVIVIALGSLIIAHAWFFAAPLGGWPSHGTWLAPFPFASQTVITHQ